MLLNHDEQQIATMLHKLQGARLGVLAALLATWPAGVGPAKLALLTGYTRYTVSQALSALEAFGYAQQHGRYHGWTATNHARQMILGESHIEDQNLALPASSTSSGVRSEEDRFLTEAQQQPRREDQNLALPTEWQALVDELRSRHRIPPRLSKPALTTAANRGATPATIRDLADWWAAYCDSDHGEGITYAPALIAARLADGTEPPVPRHHLYDDWRRFETDEERQARYEQEGEGRH